jgi:hypothetical protein
MARITKRDEKKMTKAFHNKLAGTKTTTTQIKTKTKPLLLDKIHLEDDEFITHSSIKQISKEFLQSARDLENFYQGGKKKLIVAFAYDLEVELKRLGEDRLVSKISSFIMKLLRQVGMKWSPIYLRRCLDNRYKEPVNQANALARKKNPGLPQDSDRTTQQLEAELNGQQQIGEFSVSTTLNFSKDFDATTGESNIEKAWKKWWKELLGNIIRGSYRDKQLVRAIVSIPVIAKVNVKDRNVIVEIDSNALDNLPSKIKPKTEQGQKQRKQKPSSQNQKERADSEVDDMVKKALGFT